MMEVEVVTSQSSACRGRGREGAPPPPYHHMHPPPPWRSVEIWRPMVGGAALVSAVSDTCQSGFLASTCAAFAFAFAFASRIV
ncbi:hypothetical protein CDL15_Pgr017953 [Punica granatum]|uniref:Uncharacterized protein n=1 Tax=Punica granatum TaxID=22663 RepID=A0A218WI70_PUNGR|nr:hypothetical protein CDL15_Pgr017953 [Punica granatum]